MTRHFWLLLHRYAGLAMTLFLVIVGLTGSVLAFRDELDVWLNPELLTVPPRAAPLLDPLALREKALALYPEARFDAVQLHLDPGRSVEFTVRSQTESGLAQTRLFYLDPHTGEKLGERGWGEVSLAKETIISFLYRLHMTLALPASTGGLGPYILGVTALVWTIDCFVSFYLTFPLRWRERGPRSSPAKSWWARWKLAWLIKFNAGAYRLNFDIHRAFGLWTFAMLFVFAWSSVGFNLRDEVYMPVMKLAFDMRGAFDLPAPEKPLEVPALGWPEALARGRALLAEIDGRLGVHIASERILALNRQLGVYVMVVRDSGDFSKGGGAYVVFDANTGELKASSGSGTDGAGQIISRWLYWLHMAQVFGLPYQIFVCAMGLVITALSVTGVIIWWKKRRARKFSKARRGEAAAEVASE